MTTTQTALLSVSDKTGIVELAQALRFGNVEQGKAIGSTQPFVNALQAVPVGMGLDDRPDAGIGGAFAGSLQVVVKGVEMDQGLERARHGRDFATRISTPQASPLFMRQLVGLREAEWGAVL